MTKYWQCGELYRRVYVTKETKREAPNFLMAEGSAVHSALETAMKCKMEGKVSGLGEMLMAAEIKLRQELKKVEAGMTDILGMPAHAHELSMRKVHQATAILLKEMVPQMNPIGAEHHFCAEWSPGVEIQGFIDVLNAMPRGAIEIVDLKVGGPRPPDKNTAENSVQLMVYAIMLEKITGNRPTHGTLWHYVGSPKRPHFTPRTTEFNPAKLDAIKLRIDRTVECIKAGVFAPGDPFWTCNEQRCKQFYNCALGGGK